MTIETKYNIGNEVWFQDQGQPINRDILAIKTRTCEHQQRIEYLFEYDGFVFKLLEQDLFPTKEELLKSL